MKNVTIQIGQALTRAKVGAEGGKNRVEWIPGPQGIIRWLAPYNATGPAIGMSLIFPGNILLLTHYP